MVKAMHDEDRSEVLHIGIARVDSRMLVAHYRANKRRELLEYPLFDVPQKYILQKIIQDSPFDGGDQMDEQQDTKVRFETLSAEKIPFGKNNFLEVARKKAITDEGVSEFISVSRGYYLPDGSEKYKKSITIPDDPEIKTFITDKIAKL